MARTIKVLSRTNAIRAARAVAKQCNALARTRAPGATSKCWNAAATAYGYADEGRLSVSAEWLDKARAELRRLKGGR